MRSSLLVSAWTVDCFVWWQTGSPCPSRVSQCWIGHSLLRVRNGRDCVIDHWCSEVGPHLLWPAVSMRPSQPGWELTQVWDWGVHFSPPQQHWIFACILGKQISHLAPEWAGFAALPALGAVDFCPQPRVGGNAALPCGIAL